MQGKGIDKDFWQSEHTADQKGTFNLQQVNISFCKDICKQVAV